MKEIAKRAQNLKPSATLEINAISRALKAQGKPVISFSVGEPDFSTPDFILRATKKSIDDSQNYKYTQSAGLPKLRELIARKTEHDSFLNNDFLSIDNVVVTNGGKQAVFEAFSILLDPDDEVILPAPYWLTYPEVIEFCGGKVVSILGDKLNEYKVTAHQIKSALTSKTKAILLNSPSNPTGAVYSKDELKEIAQIIKDAGIFVIADEIYDNLVYGEMANENCQAPHILEVAPELFEQTIILNGLAKTAAMTGWRIGWSVAPEKLSKTMNSLHSHLTSNVNNFVQVAAIEALQNEKEMSSEIAKMKTAFARRREIILPLLKKVFEVNNPEGAFYAFVDVSKHFGVPLGKNQVVVNSASELAKLLLEECYVACVPMEGFGIENHLRFSYALSDEQIIEGISRVVDFLSN